MKLMGGDIMLIKDDFQDPFTEQKIGDFYIAYEHLDKRVIFMLKLKDKVLYNEKERKNTEEREI
ncbi:MAG: hypothetical protein QXP36_00210 [Conexivisphaerales archaeon]